MEVATNGLSARRWVLVALVALLGLAVIAVGSSPAASGSGRAVIAKKCKKHKRSAAVAKKKKCKKHHVVLPAPGPLVRATLSWSANSEVDLHAYDASGNHTGWVEPPSPGSVVQGIPNAHHGGDVGPGGPMETFTDDIFVMGGPSNRGFSYIACLYNFPSATAYSATFTGVTKTGVSSSVPLDGPGFYSLTVPGGPATPAPGSVC